MQEIFIDHLCTNFKNFPASFWNSGVRGYLLYHLVKKIRCHNNFWKYFLSFKLKLSLPYLNNPGLNRLKIQNPYNGINRRRKV